MANVNVNIISDIKKIDEIKGNILGIIEYGINQIGATELELSHLPHQFIRMENIDKNVYEVWYTEENVIYNKYNYCKEGKSKHYCFRTVAINDTENDHIRNAEDAYHTILKDFNFEEYKIFRFWNYIPNIIELGEKGEHYKEFCTGREKAFKSFYEENGTIYPAATGIGSKGNNLCIILFAIHSDAVRICIENPRQVPAYQYPSKYGISSPKFSRATYVKCENERMLFLSGTASIIGSNSVYIGNVTKQLYTTIENINLLLSEENLSRHSAFVKSDEMKLQYLKVYMKNWEDYFSIKTICEKYFEDTNIIYMQSDICRRELLVEIEGVWI